MNVSSWLKKTPLRRLDAELILAHVLGVERTFFHAHPEHELTTKEQSRAGSLVARRVRHEPLAYILGYKEFYGRIFTVSPDVLIPRPETEVIIDDILSLAMPTSKVLDVGTGSGCIAITLAKELPNAAITGVDISAKAIKIAQKNAQSLSANVNFFSSNLLEKTAKYDIIVANLPYVDKKWDWLGPELAFEPQNALFASDDGLALIKELVQQAPDHLNKNGLLFLEADPSQHEDITDFAQKHGFLAKTPISATYGLCLYLH